MASLLKEKRKNEYNKSIRRSRKTKEEAGNEEEKGRRKIEESENREVRTLSQR